MTAKRKKMTTLFKKEVSAEKLIERIKQAKLEEDGFSGIISDAMKAIGNGGITLKEARVVFRAVDKQLKKFDRELCLTPPARAV